MRTVETDRRLRGGGHPGSVKPFNSAVQMSRVEAEVIRISDAHRDLLTEEIEKVNAELGLAVKSSDS